MNPKIHLSAQLSSSQVSAHHRAHQTQEGSSELDTHRDSISVGTAFLMLATVELRMTLNI